jgi:hypothetical protein
MPSKLFRKIFMKIRTLSLAASALCSLFLATNAFCADHRDGPFATNDPGADINDVYPFVNPRNPAELIVGVTVVPFANALSRFSDAVDYRLHIDNGSGTEQVITCKFPGSTRFTCDGISGLSASGGVGSTVRGSGGLRVYAGLRDDPFFFDLAAFNATRNALAPRFTNPGTNAFAGANTMAIVFGIPNASVSANGTRNTLKVYASTKRTGGSGISPGISGAWFDAANPGHGFTVQVVPTANAPDRLNIVWNVFDRGGRQLYLVGNGDISGSRATVPVFVTSGGTFPPPFTSMNVSTIPVGTLTFDFASCNTGSVSYAMTDPNLTASGTVSLNRLTSISGQSCSFLSAGQIDRMGRPAINTALINLVPATGSALKDAYNRAETVASWTQFQSEMQGNLAALDTLDGTANAVLPAAALAGVLVDDRLIIDVSKPACDEYLAVELGVAGKCGGRTLARDVIDDTLGAVVGPGVRDNVANDNSFLTDFPFMSDPN